MASVHHILCVMVLAVAAPTDPSDIGFPPTLPYELMMRVLPVKEIIDAYGLTQQEWDQLRVHPQFIEACRAAHKELQEEGASFRIKAKLQSEDLLKTSWNLIHDQTGDVAATVKADLIKFTWRVAGLDASVTQKAQAQAGAVAANALQININLG